MSKSFVLLFMIFMHIVDDYYLQGILAKMKQKSWWKEVAPDELYRKDYIVALLMHSLSWAFCIMLPVAIFYNFSIDFWFILMYTLNFITHAYVDNLKANKFSINLIEDQTVHIFQVIETWMILILI